MANKRTNGYFIWWTRAAHSLIDLWVRLLNSKHKNELSKVLYGGHIWSPSYYIATTSDNIMDNTKEYIINQENEDLKKG